VEGKKLAGERLEGFSSDHGEAPLVRWEVWRMETIPEEEGNACKAWGGGVVSAAEDAVDRGR